MCESKFKTSVLLILMLFFPLASFAQIPQLINYQGILTDPTTGDKLNGTYSMTFSIYASETSGTALWTETQNVTVQEGLFNVLLGSVTPLPTSLFDESDRYLGVKVGTDAEMTPRKRLVSVGYAFKAYNSDKLDSKDASSFVETGQTDAIATNMIQDNAVTAAKIAPNVLSSIDGVSNDGGNVDLVAGSNVTITPDDANNKITISAAGGGGGDDLGNHTATENIKMNNHWLSNDGDNEGVFVHPSGRVGIGITNPNSKLHVNGSVYVKDNAVIDGTARVGNFRMINGAGAGKVLTSDIDGVGSWQAVNGDNLGNHTATQNLKLNGHWLSKDGGNEGIYVTAAGKVGVGTNAPSSNFAAIGNARIGATSNTATGTYAVSIGEDCGAGDAVSIAIGKSCAASAAYAVAIGRNATANNMNCVSAGYYCNAYGNPSLALGSRIAVGGNYSVGIGLDNTTRQLTASHVLSIMGGKVGIGTLNPSYSLDVSGTTQMTGFKMPTGAGSGKVLTSDVSGNGTWQTAPGADNLGNHTATQNLKLNGHWLSGDGGNEGVYVNNSGKVGIGTNSPNSTFKTVGNGSIGSSSNSATGTYAVALGEDCGAGDAASIAIGKSCASSAAYAVAIGYQATANNLGAASLGYKTNGYGWYSLALGSQIAVGGNHSVGIGLDNTHREFTTPNVLAIMGGNVGIGTTNPGNILTIKQSSSTDPIADAWTTYSSKRWKTNIHEIDNALDKVMKLRGVSFDWKQDGKHDIGLIAEEVGQLFPEIVAYEENGVDAKSLDYSRLVAVLIEAVKEQQKLIEKQGAELEKIKAKMTNF